MNKKFLSTAIVASMVTTSTMGVGYAQESAENDIKVTDKNTNQNVRNLDGIESKQIFSAGEGSLENPYVVSNLEEFKAFRDDVNSGNNYSGKYIKLGVDIELNNEEWTPIGSSTNSFNGNFDGDGRTVSNLKISKDLENKSENNRIGLFGKITSPSTIKNLNIKNVDLKGSLYVGALVGEGFTGSVSDIHISGSIKIDAWWYAGGIIGNGYASISNCSVVANDGSYIKGNNGSYIGGIIGFRGEGVRTLDNCNVENINIIGIDRLGGISGIAHYGSYITDCNVKDVEIFSEDPECKTIGLIAGANLAGTAGNDVRIIDCEARNSVANITGSNEKIHQKISMYTHTGDLVTSKVIVGNNITFDDTGKKVISGDFEILTSDMCQDGKKAAQIESSKAIIVDEGTVAVIKDGYTYKEYSSISDAISESSGEFIEITDNINEGLSIVNDVVKKRNLPINSYINIDLNGYTLSSSTGSALNISGSSVNIKGGTISTSDSGVGAVIISNDANVRFRDINFVIAANSSESPVQVSDGGATLTVAGTITSENLGDKKVISNEGNGNITLNIEKGTTSSGDSVHADNTGNLIDTTPDNNTAADVPSLGDVDSGNDSPSVGGGSTSKPTYTNTQIVGKDRYETAAKLADKIGNYDTVILVNSDKTMADGLSAASLAGKLNAPILPVKQNKIPDSVMQRIEKAKNVYIIGGTEAISKDVENKLSSKEITRVSGKTRYETSQKIAEMMGNYTEAYIVNGLTGEADAMSISSVAAKKGAPIIVTDGKKSDYVKKSGTDYTVIGGEKAVTKELASKYSADRISGTNRYKTNRAVMDKFYSGADTVYLANGETLVDAMSASLIAKNSGVVLVSKNSDNSILKSRNTIQVGGTPFEVNILK